MTRGVNLLRATRGQREVEASGVSRHRVGRRPCSLVSQTWEQSKQTHSARPVHHPRSPPHHTVDAKALRKWRTSRSVTRRPAARNASPVMAIMTVANLLCAGWRRGVEAWVGLAWGGGMWQAGNRRVCRRQPATRLCLRRAFLRQAGCQHRSPAQSAHTPIHSTAVQHSKRPPSQPQQPCPSSHVRYSTMAHISCARHTMHIWMRFISWLFSWALRRNGGRQGAARGIKALLHALCWRRQRPHSPERRRACRLHI